MTKIYRSEMAEYRAECDKRKREAGLVRVCDWVPADKKAEYKQIAKELRGE